MGLHSSSGRAWRLCRALALAALLAGTGCAGKGAPHPAPADPGVPRPGSTGRPAPSSPGESTRAAAGKALDPSEEITPEQLASIPEPLPGSSPALKAIGDRPMESGAPAPSEGPSGAAGTAGATDAEAPSGPWVWKVQVFASDRREEAERVSREAAQALSTAASVDRDGAIYKVRLGRFGTEGEAQALRERAIAAGYPGAFRIRTAATK